MSIRCQHEELIRAKPSRVFAAIDDLPSTARWLPPCVSLEKIGDGPNRPGDRLRYVYREGKSTKEMEGVIVDREPDRRLHCRYSDAMFDVSVDMRIEPAAQGSKILHIIEMTPKTLVGKLLSPVIRLALRPQTRKAAANLKALLEAADSPAMVPTETPPGAAG